MGAPLLTTAAHTPWTPEHPMVYSEGHSPTPEASQAQLQVLQLLLQLLRPSLGRWYRLHEPLNQAWSTQGNPHGHNAHLQLLDFLLQLHPHELLILHPQVQLTQLRILPGSAWRGEPALALPAIHLSAPVRAVHGMDRN